MNVPEDKNEQFIRLCPAHVDRRYRNTRDGNAQRRTRRETSKPSPGRNDPLFRCPGFSVLFYILTITWVAPRFGISNAIAFVLLGQLIAMSLIDHFGLMGVQKFTMSLKRLTGLGVMTIGVFLVLNKVPGGAR